MGERIQKWIVTNDTALGGQMLGQHLAGFSDEQIAANLDASRPGKRVGKWQASQVRGYLRCSEHIVERQTEITPMDAFYTVSAIKRWLGQMTEVDMIQHLVYYVAEIQELASAYSEHKAVGRAIEQTTEQVRAEMRSKMCPACFEIHAGDCA